MTWRVLSLMFAAAAVAFGFRCAPTPRSGIVLQDHQPAHGVSRPTIVSMPGLNNVSKLHGYIISGSEPRGDKGFDSLQLLGVKTIVSVDGAKPDLERAHARGMRYVHLPIGYDGIPEDTGLQLVRAVRDLSKPIYIHCHHGKHRGPAAAAYVLVARGFLSPLEATELMHQLGTAPKYAGLYRAVQNARTIPNNIVDTASDDFPEHALLADLATAMAAISRTWENVDYIRQANWQTPVDHPDLDPQTEPTILAEHFRELLRLPDAVEWSAGLLVGLTEAERTAWTLVNAQSLAEHNKEYLSLRAQCESCHERYRN